MNKQQKKRENWIEYYDHKSILNEITDETVTVIRYIPVLGKIED